MGDADDWASRFWLALGVLVSTDATDAFDGMFNATVAAHRRVPAAKWSSIRSGERF
jgi:hypothetical protein